MKKISQTENKIAQKIFVKRNRGNIFPQLKLKD